MSCYISSNANRLYAGLESEYGHVPVVTGANRIAAVKLTARQSLVTAERRDKAPEAEGTLAAPTAARGGAGHDVRP